MIYSIVLRRTVIEETCLVVEASSENAARRRAHLLARGDAKPKEVDDTPIEDEGEWMPVSLGRAVTKRIESVKG